MKAFNPFGHNKPQPVEKLDTRDFAPESKSAQINSSDEVVQTAPVKKFGFDFNKPKIAAPTAVQNPNIAGSANNSNNVRLETKAFVPQSRPVNSNAQNNFNNNNSDSIQEPIVRKPAFSFNSPRGNNNNINTQPSNTANTLPNQNNPGKTHTINTQAEKEQYQNISGIVLEDSLDLVDIKPNKDGSVSKDTPIFEAEKAVPVNANPDQLTDRDQKRLEFMALREKVRDIKLTEILKAIGAHNNEDKIRNKWKMPWGDNISINGQQWYNHNATTSFKGSRGALSFVKYFMAIEHGYDLDDVLQARKAENRGVYWLAEQFDEQIDKADIMAARENAEYSIKKPYVPPVVLEHYLPKIKEYLMKERSIPEWLIDKQVKAGKLYASMPSQFINSSHWEHGKQIRNKKDLHNLNDNEIYCIFKSGDDKMGAAECRCILDNSANMTKGFSEGSHKKLFGFLVVAEPGFEIKEIALTEAAIDALSYQALHPYASVISTGGTDNPDFIMKIAQEVLDNPNFNLVMAFDADNAGDNCALGILEQLKKIIGDEKIQEYLDSGKLSRRRSPVGKDWNDYLKTKQQHELYVPSIEAVEEKPLEKVAKPKKLATKLVEETLPVEKEEAISTLTPEAVTPIASKPKTPFTFNLPARRAAIIDNEIQVPENVKTFKPRM